jgi:hypothetical protein
MGTYDRFNGTARDDSDLIRETEEALSETCWNHLSSTDGAILFTDKYGEPFLECEEMPCYGDCPFRPK